MELLALIGLIIIAIALSTGLGFGISSSMKEEKYAGFVVTTIIESIVIAIMIFKFCVLK